MTALSPNPWPRPESARAQSTRSIVTTALSEIDNRDDRFLSLFQIPLPDPKDFTARHRDVLDQGSIDRATAEEAIVLGSRSLQAQYPGRTERGTGFFADWIGANLIDTHRAVHDDLDFVLPDPPTVTVRSAFRRLYSLRTTRSGARYYISMSGTIPLVLVNATGLPIETWQRLLVDPDHNYRIIIPIRPHGDVFSGGIADHCPIDQEATEIEDILNTERLNGVHILGWCNGARLAIELASRLGERAISLIFMTPMLKGIKGIPPSPTPYARDLQMVLDMVGKDPKLATIFARKIADTAAPMDWDKVSADDPKQVEGIFRLPNRRNLELLLTPLLNPDSLTNVSRRVESDEQHPTLETLAGLTLPMMIILGSHDTIVSNQTTLDVMRAADCKPIILRLAGAGHDIHDLQYPYMRHALTHFINRRQVPAPLVRMPRVV